MTIAIHSAWRSVMLVVAVLGVGAFAAPSRAVAEAPQYEPYGAWRGRIRYVEGPRRTRTHIRWGNGITPVGGQVLMHLATVAGEVATNENFLNAVTGRDAEINADLVKDVAAINAKNPEMLTRLNELRQQLDLEPVVFKSTTSLESTESTDMPVQTNDGQVIPDVNALIGPWTDSKTAVSKRRNELRTSVAGLAATDDTTLGTADAEKRRRDLLRESLNKTVLAGVTADGTPMMPGSVAAFIAATRELDVELGSFIEVLELAEKNGVKLLNASASAEPERKKVLQGEIDAYKKYLEELKALRDALKM